MLVQIPEHPDYFVNDKGEVYSIRPDRWGNRKWRKLTPQLNHNGYLRIALGRSAVDFVHALVALAWIGPKPKGMQINHKDGNKLNNAPENLEYVSPSENIKHAYKTGLAHVKLTNAQREEIKALKGTMLRREAAKLFGVSPQSISLIWRDNQ